MATGAIAAVGVGVSLYGSLAKQAEARRMEEKFQEKINNFEWAKTENAYDNTTISTTGGELMIDNANVNTASMVEKARAGGTRGLAYLGAIQAQNNQVAKAVADNWDKQQKEISFAKAGDEAVIRGMEEDRQRNELAGWGNALGVGKDMKYQSYADLSSSSSAMMEGLYGGMGKGMGEQLDTSAGGSWFSSFKKD